MCEENPPNAERIGGIVLWGDERDGTAAVPYEKISDRAPILNRRAAL